VTERAPDTAPSELHVPPASPGVATAPLPPAPAGPAEISVVVLSWNTLELLRACLASLDVARRVLPLQVIVVDNASDDGSADMVAAEFAWAELLRNPVNDGYARGNNLGAARATAPWLMLLNSDTEVPPDVLPTLRDFLASHPDYGGVAPLLHHADGTVQRSCKRFPTLGVALFFDTYFERWFPQNKVLPRYFMSDFDHEHSADVDQPPAAAFLLSRAHWEQLGGFDERLWLFFNDVDLCRRLHARGLKIRYLAEARILHHEGKSTSRFHEMGREWHRNRLAYFRKVFGLRGTLLCRLMSSLRGWEEARKLKRAGAPPEARARVWQIVKEIWTA